MPALAEVTRPVTPAYAHIPEAAYTDGDQVAGLCDEAAFGPFAEQRLALDGIFAKDRRGRSVAFESWLLCCRQNLKTGVEIQSALGWAFLFKENPIMFTANKWKPGVAEAFLTMERIIQGYAWMRRQVLYIHHGDRDMEIALTNGARILFGTRTKDSGRALAGAKTILDEGWALLASHMGGLLPAMAARSITGDPQILGGSSAAHLESLVLHEIIERGRAAAADPQMAVLERRLLYLEFCAPPPEVACDRGARCDHGKRTAGCGCDKREYVVLANPATDRLISWEFIQGERRALPVEEYCRERMGWHEWPVGAGAVIPLTEWAAGLDTGSEPAGPVMLSVVYGRGQKTAAIGLAGVRADRRWHVEVADEVTPSRVGFRVREIIARAAGDGRVVAQPVAVDGNAYEKAAIPALEQRLTFDEATAGLPPLEVKRLAPLEAHWPETVQVRTMSTGDVVAAFTGFRDCLNEAHNLRHRGQDSLTTALVGACSRPVGDAGEAWGRRKSESDIECIVAVTQARWLHEQECPQADVEPGVWAL